MPGKADTANALDAMVAGIANRKAEKATKLTPVGTESMKVNEMPSDLPGRYMAKEELRDMARDLRTKAQNMIEIADALDAYTQEPTVAAPSQGEMDAANKKAAEAEADRRIASGEVETTADFQREFARKQAEAQAATFKQPEPSGWVCPEHGDEALETLTSRKGGGRVYKACSMAGCTEFER